LELGDELVGNMDPVVGLAVVVEEVSVNIKEVENEGSEDGNLNSEDVPMATSEPEVDELFDDETAHLILAEDTGVASEGEVMGLLGDLSRAPSFVDGKKGKEREDQLDSEIQLDQDFYQDNHDFHGGDGESSFEGFDEDKPHAGMGVHSVTPELSTVVVIRQNISLPPSPGPSHSVTSPSNAVVGPSTIVVQSPSVSNASPSTSRSQGGKSEFLFFDYSIRLV
jgi:hypothetical protein